MSTTPAIISNPSRVDLAVSTAELNPVKVLAPGSTEAAIAVTLLLDIRTSIEALSAVLKRQADGSAYYPDYHHVASMLETTNKLIGSRVG